MGSYEDYKKLDNQRAENFTLQEFMVTKNKSSQKSLKCGSTSRSGQRAHSSTRDFAANSNLLALPEKVIGTENWFSKRYRHGFITGNDTHEDVFFHKMSSLRTGEGLAKKPALPSMLSSVAKAARWQMSSNLTKEAPLIYPGRDTNGLTIMNMF